MNKCPKCGSSTLVTRTSRRVGKTIEARRECRDKIECGYKELARIRPAEVVSIKLL